MPENDKQPTPRDGLQEEYRSVTTAIAAVTIPAATVLKPVATEWAKQKFQTDDKSKDSAPPPQSKDD